MERDISLRKLILLFFFCILFSGLISLILGQDANWDLKNYHFYNPYSLIKDRLNYDFNPAQKQTYFNPLPHLLFYFLVNNFHPVVVGFILGGIQGINLFLLFISSITGYLGAMNISEIGRTFNDNILSIFVLLSLFIVVKELQKKLNKKFLFISGFIVAFAFGLNLSNVIFLVGMGLSLLIIYLKIMINCIF